MTEISATSDLEMQLTQHLRKPVQWSPPTEFDLTSTEARHELGNRFSVGEIRTVFDPVVEVANDLYEYNHPDKKDDVQRREAFVDDILRQGSQYGRWFLFPWSGELVRYPEMAEHRALRTSRNRDLITADEQSRLYDSTVAVFGLSVGSKVVENLVTSGIGGKIIIGDPDSITPSNLNRLSAGFTDVGSLKLDTAAKNISEIDPYIEQVHFTDGVTNENLELLNEHKPAVVFDEVDDLAIKAALRKFGDKAGVPIVMATDLGDRSLIDVERYDLSDTKPFNGRLKPAEVESLAEGSVSPERVLKLMMKIVGIRHITSRMLQSAMEIDKTLPGMPQLGTTAAVGGAHAAIAAREIILGRKLSSGRYVCSPKKTLHLQPQATVKEGLGTVKSFVQNMRESS